MVAKLKDLRVSTNRAHGEQLKAEYQAWKELQIENHKGFFPVWNDFKQYLHCDKLTGGALRLYLFLGIVSKNKTGESWYPVERMAEELGCSPRSIIEWARELRDHGLIERQQLRINGYAFSYLRPFEEVDGQ